MKRTQAPGNSCPIRFSNLSSVDFIQPQSVYLVGKNNVTYGRIGARASNSFFMSSFLKWDFWIPTCTLQHQTENRSSCAWKCCLELFTLHRRHAKPWESPLLTLKENISLPRICWLLVMESLILPFEHPLKINKKYLYLFTVFMCFENEISYCLS